MNLHTQVYPVSSWLQNGIYSLQVAYHIVGGVNEEACGNTVPHTWILGKTGTGSNGGIRIVHMCVLYLYNLLYMVSLLTAAYACLHMYTQSIELVAGCN